MDDLTRHRKRRLRELVDAPPYRGSQAALAIAIGKTESYVSQLANPEKYPFGELTAKRIAGALHLDERYFEHGYSTDGDSMVVPLLNVFVGAGAGKLNAAEEEEIGGLAFRTSFLRECDIYSPSDAMVLNVKGLSMGELWDGAVVLVNRKKREPIKRKIFVFVDDLGPVVKRVVYEQDRWIARSDNVNFPDFPFHDGHRLLGRAMWMGAKL